jgi:hypothetical protein
MALKELVIEMEQVLDKQNYEQNFSFGIVGEHRFTFTFIETFLQHQGYDVVKMNLGDVDLMNLFRPDLQIDTSEGAPARFEQEEQRQIAFISDRLRQCLEQCQSLAKPIILFDEMHRIYYPSESKIAQWLGDNQTFNLTKEDGTDIKVPTVLASQADMQGTTRKCFFEGYNPYIEARYLKNMSGLKKAFDEDLKARLKRNDLLNQQNLAREQANSSYQWAV